VRRAARAFPRWRNLPRREAIEAGGGAKLKQPADIRTLVDFDGTDARGKTVKVVKIRPVVPARRLSTGR